MRIVHLSLQAPYNEGWGYQENLLPKYQARSGHEVTLITSCRKNSPNNTVVNCEPEEYMSPDNFRVIRINNKRIINNRISDVLGLCRIYELLRKLKPDFIMVHGLGNCSALQIKKYVKHDNPDCTVIADNHLDNNIGSGFLRKNILIKAYLLALRMMNKSMQKLYKKVYGVTPWRSEYANLVFGIKMEKLDVLPAGADDDKIDYENKGKIRKEIRQKHNIADDDFLIVSGGKIDAKKNIHTLMQAVSELDDKKVKLLVFGNPSSDISETFEKLAENENIISVGWITADETYNYFLASDLVFFPGQHSVMWEQSVACGIPIVMKYYHAMQHCDIGGNAKFLYDDSKNGISALIKEILHDDTYQRMLNVACSEKRKQFLYSELAKKSIEAVKEK